MNIIPVRFEVMNADVTVDQEQTVSFNLDNSLQNTSISVTCPQQIYVTVVNNATGEAVPTETDAYNSNTTIAYIPESQVCFIRVCHHSCMFIPRLWKMLLSGLAIGVTYNFDQYI